jgi:hypothetical protein
MSDVQTCDASAVQIFHELFESYRVRFTYSRCILCMPLTTLNAQAREVGVFITHLRAEPRVMFERGGIVKLLGADAFHENISTVMGRLTRETRR